MADTRVSHAGCRQELRSKTNGCKMWWQGLGRGPAIGSAETCVGRLDHWSLSLRSGDRLAHSSRKRLNGSETTALSSTPTRLRETADQMSLNSSIGGTTIATNLGFVQSSGIG